jgi:hypothetical protein
MRSPRSVVVLAGLLVLLALTLSACAGLRITEPRTAVLVPLGSTCVVHPDGHLCTPPAPPPSYALTIALTGGGTATTAVTPPGPQVAGTVRTLTVTPTDGSLLGAWSAGCADTMPQPAADTTCTRTVTPAPGPTSAPAFDQAVTVYVSGQGTLEVPFVPTGGQRALYLWTYTWAPNAPITVSHCGTPMPAVATLSPTGSDYPNVMRLHRLIAPSTDATCRLRIETAPGQLVWGVGASFTGVHQTAPDRGLTQRAVGRSGPQTLAVTSAVNDLAVDVFVHVQGATGRTAGTGQTVRYSDNLGNRGLGLSTIAGGTPTVPMAWTAAGDAYDKVHWAVSLVGAGGPPAQSFTLTLAQDGTGQCTLTGGGTYSAGTAVTPTATPAAGSVFAGWSPPVPITMDANKTATATCNLSQSPITNLEWVQLWQMPPQPTGPRTPNWYNLVVDKQGRFYFHNWSGELWQVDPVAQTQRKVAQWQAPENGPHNCGFVYDPETETVRMSGQCNPSPDVQQYYFHVPTETSGVYCPTPCAGGANAASTYDPLNHRLLAWAGWLTSITYYDQLRTFALPNGPWIATTVNPHPAPEVPTESQPCTRLAHNRAGYDSTRNKAWIMMKDGVLWWLDGMTWSSVQTTGDVPELCSIYTYDAAVGGIVAWTGKNEATGGTGADIRKTRVLDMTTLVWREAVTATRPPATGVTILSMRYDPVRRQTLALVGDVWWALRGPGYIPPQTGDFPAWPTRVFKALNQPSDSQKSWTVKGSKDVQRVFDAKRGKVLWGTGDYSSQFWINTGQNTIFESDVKAMVAAVGKPEPNAGWSLRVAACHEPGQISPPRPTDRGIFVIDEQRDELLLWSRINEVQPGGTCSEQAGQGSTYTDGLLAFPLNQPNARWRVAAPRGAIGNTLSMGAYSAKTHQVVYLSDVLTCPYGGFSVRAMALATYTDASTVNSCWLPETTPAGLWVSDQAGYQATFGWDAAREEALICVVYIKYTSPGSGVSAERRYGCHLYAHATRTLTPVAPVPPAPPVPGWYPKTYYSHNTYDSVNQKYLWPVSTDAADSQPACGLIHAMWVYDRATNTWENIPVALEGISEAKPRGTLSVFDPTTNLMIVGSTGFCDPPLMNNTPPFAWRYR